VWGAADDIFVEEWGRKWAGLFRRSTFYSIPDAGHFLQNTHGEEIAMRLLQCIQSERVSD
jgi:haloalkane dehalogenase